MRVDVYLKVAKLFKGGKEGSSMNHTINPRRNLCVPVPERSVAIKNVLSFWR